MDNFKRNNNKFGGRRNGGGGGFSGRNSQRPEMHKAVCSECGKDCEVPFKPTGEKPIFCSDCFRNKRNDTPGRSNERDSGRRNSNDREMYKAVCDKCGKDCEVPFKPSSDKPIYCSECFNKDKGENKNNSSGQANKQFEIINAKLDKILEKLNPTVALKVEEKKKPVKKDKVSEPKITTKSKVKKVSPKKATLKTKPKKKK